MMGQYAEAEKSAAEAKKWSLIGIAASAVIWVLYIIIYVLIIGVALANS